MHIKKFLILLLASVIVGCAVIAIFYWIFSYSLSDAISFGITVTIASLVTEFLKPFFEKLSKRQKDAIDKRGRRNLNRKRQ